MLDEMGYEYQKLETPEEELELQELPRESINPAIKKELGPEEIPYKNQLARNPKLTRAIAATMFGLLITLAVVGVAHSAYVDKRATSTSSSSTEVPQYFQTTPELYLGASLYLLSQIVSVADQGYRSYCYRAYAFLS